MKTKTGVLAGGMILLVAVLGGGALAEDPAPEELTPDGVRALVEQLRSDRFDERTEAAARLEKGVVTEAQIDALAEFADDASLEVRQRVRKLLRAKGWIHADDRAQIKVWLAALRGDDRDARREAFEGLADYAASLSDPFGDLMKLTVRTPRLEVKAPSIVFMKLDKVDGVLRLRGEMTATIALRNWSKDPMWIEDEESSITVEPHHGPLLPGTEGEGGAFRLFRSGRRRESTDGGSYRVLDARKRLEFSRPVTFEVPGRYSLSVIYDPSGQSVSSSGGAIVKVPIATDRVSRARTVVVLPSLEEGEAPTVDGFRLGLRSEVLETTRRGRKIRLDFSIANTDEAKRPFKGIDGGVWDGAWIAVLDDADRLYAHQRVLRRDEAKPDGSGVAEIEGGGKLERRFDLDLPLPKGIYRIVAGYSTKVGDEQYAEMWSNVVTLEVD